MPSPPVIFTLPPELLQHIIIASAFGAPPSTITAISETCKLLYSLVYNPTDHHFWREIFLTVFDDPRPALTYITALHGEQPAFGWEQEFKSRMRAARVVYRSNQAPHSTNFDAQRPATRSMTSQMILKRSSEMRITLHTLLSVLRTCLPFRSTTTVTFGPGPLPSLGPGIPPKYPTFPPLVLLLSSSFCNPSNKSQFSCVFESTSSQWLEDILRDGFPRVLTRRLLASPGLLEAPYGDDTISNATDLLEAPPEQELKEWAKSDEARLFYKLVAHTGFIPVRAPAQDVEAYQMSSAEDADLSNDQVSVDGDIFFTPNASPPLGSDDPSPQMAPTPQKDFADAQFISARRMARRTVYDLRFLQPERMFGPFMPSPPDEFPDEQEGSRQGKARRSQGDGDESDDSAYVYHSIDSYSNGDDAASSANGADDLFPLIDLITPEDVDAAPAENRLPSPHTLMPDWTWLAGARIIVEANLRDMLRRTSTVDTGLHGAETGIDDVTDALRRVQGLRMGGAPGFWDGWTARSRRPVHEERGIDTKGKSKANETCERSEQGWDWAGAAGTWKRCICWLDYRDLLINNLQFGTNRFNGDTLQEALRVFPMTLRVSRYSWPPAFPSSSSSHSVASRLPIIHVEGEMSGLDQDITRYLKGTISMIGDGAVRWSLISSRSGESPAEWSTEGVQIGGVGSALGVLGLWTGADHERTDPLGPFWLWKVA